ncbi:NUDIX hydrolase [Sphingobacterium psychroaquaticum]|uniref:ADP-ribose pyrophosphatase YjhB, NUDIX family n=1 Tax=Sphingobacterium psychroaquaticum TaxID=561061 RepID=A0A1X7JLF0_9SPHI|nr:NUDIX domain-containing protein [Sphingobacterium psychroaquaticum]QBQ40795.1 NUDIX hydrolase [Sphingobacterium psychroaquaticum]SMG28863.1 ADP-ribose pyrophosphatase YjhB, NUDIX family [Sphingobacterium psychroaquaticum]
MDFYKSEPKTLLAVDCIIFGFDGESLQILLIKRGLEPERNKWSLMGGFVQADESPEEAASHVLFKLTGLENVYMEQCGVFGNPNREKYGRVVSLTYFALIDTKQYTHIITDEYEAKWFPVNKHPTLIFDHLDMITVAKRALRTKAALYPILFELLPEKFTIPQISALYEAVYDTELDKRNFNRKLLSSDLLIKLNEKDKEHSKKGAFYYKLNMDLYKEKIMSFLRYLPSWSIEG